ncbi:MAG: hypothetical protein AAB395_00400 [Patescibacteria group bacterium]
MRRDQKCIRAAKYLFALWMLSLLAGVASAAIFGQESMESLGVTWLFAAVNLLLTLTIIGLIIPNIIYLASENKPQSQ